MKKSKLAIDGKPTTGAGRFGLPSPNNDLEKSGKKYTLPKKSAVSHLHPVKPSKKPRSPKGYLTFESKEAFADALGPITLECEVRGFTYYFTPHAIYRALQRSTRSKPAVKGKKGRRRRSKK